MIKCFIRATRRAKSFSNNQDGATAIEFAFVAIPFFALIFAILELAIIFFVTSTLSNAVSETGRLIRVGQFQNCTPERFKERVCESMSNLGQCSQNLRIDVVSEPTFSAINIPDTPELEDDGSGNLVPPAGQFDTALASTPVVVQATLFYQLSLPPQLTRLESTPGSGVRILKSTTAFRTEPFPPAGSCQS